MAQRSLARTVVQGAPDGSFRIWFPGDEKPAAPIRPWQMASGQAVETRNPMP